MRLAWRPCCSTLVHLSPPAHLILHPQGVHMVPHFPAKAAHLQSPASNNVIDPNIQTSKHWECKDTELCVQSASASQKAN